MSIPNKHITIFLLSFTLLCAVGTINAEEAASESIDHSAHISFADQGKGFKGIFYGFLPCTDCTGIKKTLSLKQNNNYLLVTQYAKDSAREYYEKGKYTWDDKTKTVTLKPNKDEPSIQLRIENDSVLVLLNPDGTAMAGNQDDYSLRRSDIAKSRDVHIH